MTKSDNILIVGLGLIGGSYAMGLTKRGYNVSAIDTDDSTVKWALQNHLVKKAAPAGTPLAQLLVQKASHIILCLYPAAILAWLEEHKPFLRPGVLLTDVAGVKGSFAEQAQRLLGEETEFIPSHPMAGREVSGVQNADDAMFFGANFIITPTNRNTPKGIAFAHELADTLGFGRVTELSVEEHDRMIGYVSQLTHAIAVSLMNANDDPRLPAVTGDSFRDLTRIADMNDLLWSELFLANKTALLDEIDTFCAALQDVRTALQQEDREALRLLMQKSTARRKQFGRR